jgi:Allene oxide cyclase barrel like domain
MRKLITAAAAVALVVLSVAAFASASASTRSAPGTTVSFIAKTTQLSQIDLPPTGFGQGDEVVFHDLLLSHGQVIGHDGGSCQATFVAKGRVPQFQCLVTFVLRGGQVTAQGLLNIANPASFRGMFSITGGTGIYRTARGQATIHQTSATLATITLSLIP